MAIRKTKSTTRRIARSGGASVRVTVRRTVTISRSISRVRRCR